MSSWEGQTWAFGYLSCSLHFLHSTIPIPLPSSLTLILPPNTHCLSQPSGGRASASASARACDVARRPPRVQIGGPLGHFPSAEEESLFGLKATESKFDLWRGSPATSTRTIARRRITRIQSWYFPNFMLFYFDDFQAVGFGMLRLFWLWHVEPYFPA